MKQVSINQEVERVLESKIRIQGILLSEFNEKLGLRMISSYAVNNVISQQQFSLYSKMILPKQQLCNRLIAIQYRQKYFILGVPSISTNTQTDKTYQREKYIYSINIIVLKELYLTNQKIYNDLVKKLGNFYKSLEESQNLHLIYHNHIHINYINKTIQDIYQSINEKHQVNLTFLCNFYAFIGLNSSPIKNISNITLSSVPVTNLTPKQIASIQSQLGRSLVEFAYKSEFTIKKIYDLLKNKIKDLKVDQIYKFYQKGMEMGVIFMVDMFSLDNRYALTSEMNKLISLKGDTWEKFKKMCSGLKYNQNDQLSYQFVLKVLFNFERKNTIGKILQLHPMKFKKINFIKLIRLGQILGVIKRIHQIIVYEEPNNIYISYQAIKKQRYYIDYQNNPSNLELKFKTHLAAMSTIDQMIVDMEIDRDTLLAISNPKNRCIMYVSQYS